MAVREIRDEPSERQFREAAASITAQTLRDIEIIVVLNRQVVDAAARRVVVEAFGGDSRVRILDRAPEGELNLAAAMNLAATEARAELFARMDDDDWSHPRRLERQVAFMRANPVAAGVGAWYERMEFGGRVIERVEVPSEPGEVRWRLLLNNCFAHGSMVLRRSALVEVGGYDESLERAEDYGLWPRMTRRGMALANLPEVLYRHRAPRGVGPDRAAPASDAAQARAATGALLEAWQELPDRTADAGLRGAMVLAMTDPRAGVRAISELLTREGPSRAGLTAYLWATALFGGGVAGVIERAGKLALLRAAAERAMEAGARKLWLWGAGKHTAWVMRHADQLCLPIGGIVDDSRAGSVAHGLLIERPEALAPGEHVLISSDAFEPDIWARSAPIRQRGVRVWRMYASDAESAGLTKHAEAAA